MHGAGATAFGPAKSRWKHCRRRRASVPDTRTPSMSELLAALPEGQREVLLLLKGCGMTLEEVARVTSSTVGAVKQKAHRAYECLRAALLYVRRGARNDLPRHCEVAGQRRAFTRGRRQSTCAPASAAGCWPALPPPYSGPVSLGADLEQRLIAVVTSDLAAVRPLSSPRVYTAALLAVAAVVAAAGVALLGVRGWLGTSIVQKLYFVTLLIAGIAACAVTLSRLDVPRRIAPRPHRILAALAIAAVLGAGALYPLLHTTISAGRGRLFQHRNGPCSHRVYRRRIHPAARSGIVAAGPRPRPPDSWEDSPASSFSSYSARISTPDTTYWHTPPW